MALSGLDQQLASLQIGDNDEKPTPKVSKSCKVIWADDIEETEEESTERVRTYSQSFQNSI